MAQDKLAEIRAKLAKIEEKSSGNNQSSDRALFRHWDIKNNETTTVRFLPDQDADNTFFWVERQVVRLKFPGIKGGDEKKGVTVQVPCGEMFGDDCPIHKEIRPWFKDPGLESLARSYWKKRSYIFQGFVVDNKLDEEPPENPIRRFVINPQIFNLIKSALMDPDMEHIPTDYVNGTDFRITKTQNGEYSNYTTSSWARKERALTEDELKAIDEHGLNNLADFLPARPSADQYDIIAEMFAASVDGDLYDPARFAEHYRPFGVDMPTNTSVQKPTAPVSTKTSETQSTESAHTEKDQDDKAPWEESKDQEKPAAEESASADESSSSASSKTDDILAMIRNRQNQ